jgi:hypothetical protein
MKTVLVFKTSVSTASGVNRVQQLLNDLMHENEHWNFDLEDCDRILRVESFVLKARDIEDQLKKAGFLCVELPD